MQRPRVEDLTGDHAVAQLARQHWLTSTPSKVLPDVVKLLWSAAVEDDSTSFTLLLLEQLQTLERYLWPGYGDTSSDQHVLLLALLVNVKRQDRLPPVWPVFAQRPEDLASLFTRITHLSIDTSLPTKLRTHLLCFMVGAFQSLDSAAVRKECAPLVSIGVWQHLHSEQARQERLAKSSQLKKAWRAAEKKLEAADLAGQARLRFERSWLYTLLLDFFDKLYDEQASVEHKADNLRYCERLVELICDLLSQLPTRRYVNALLQDLNIVSVIRLSPLYQDGDNRALFRQMQGLMEHYIAFPVDDHTGRALSPKECDSAHNLRLARLQSVALIQHPEKLKLLVLANYASLSSPSDLSSHLTALTDIELIALCSQLSLRTAYPAKSLIVQDRTFIAEILTSSLASASNLQDSVRTTTILPTESDLYAPALLRTTHNDGTRPLAIPKPNLQFLTPADFLHRAFTLTRVEAFTNLRQHVEETLARIQPWQQQSGQMRFDGFSRMALPLLSKPAIIEVLPTRVGESDPAEVRVEVSLDVAALQEGVRKEWEGLRSGECVFLLAVQPTMSEGANGRTRRDGDPAREDEEQEMPSGLQMLRCAEVISVLDEHGHALHMHSEVNSHPAQNGTARPARNARQRRLLLRLDAAAYSRDAALAKSSKEDLYASVNLVVRRKGRENNFKAELEGLKEQLHECLYSDFDGDKGRRTLPPWLRELFLGYGDPKATSAASSVLAEKNKDLPPRLRVVDCGSMFLDWTHLVEALPGRSLGPNSDDGALVDGEGLPRPPFVLHSSAEIGVAEDVAPLPTALKKANRKRRRDEAGGPEPAAEAELRSVKETIKISTAPSIFEPYPSTFTIPDTVTIRFTAPQVSAILAGTQPGLTLIHGPPGTGKTDVTTQIIANLYRNLPKERVLLVAHSNHALDQLCRKLSPVVEGRHLLRVGFGGDEGDDVGGAPGEAGAEKFGRVGDLQTRGASALREVSRLAESLGEPAAHGESCERAQYFDEVWVRPRWKVFWSQVDAGSPLEDGFPFHAFFANSPHQPLFSPEASREAHLIVARGCETYMQGLFQELAALRPLELLRSQKQKTEYLLLQQARVVAMTATHAAARGRELARLGVDFASVIVEEAAQLTEAETWVALAMHHTSTVTPTGTAGLQRLVLIGDHLQNTPVVSNIAVRDYAQLDQPLFQRLTRLGVQPIALTAQGRARPSLASLCAWRYPALSNLPHTSSLPEFTRANAGLRWEYQFIDVDDYKGVGESAPRPHFWQNLGEAEYAVALYQYMRLLGYPAAQVSIVCAYTGQVALVRDVLAHRCRGKAGFGMPGWVGTVDGYQGEQNDYIILSLVRTRGVGYLRDLRRLTVALSRARLGLYVLGRREVFEGSLELSAAFERLLQRPAKLELVTGEMWPATRGVAEEIEAVEMAGVEHLGQYVFEMTQAKVRALKEGDEVAAPSTAEVLEEDDGYGGGDAERDEEEDVAADVDEGDEESGLATKRRRKV